MTDVVAGKGYVLSSFEGDGFWFLGSHVAMKVTGAESEGAIAIMESRAPRGHGSPLHVHTNEDEIFHVLEGELRVEVGDETHIVGPGMLAFGPRGVKHRFVVTSDEARFMLIVTPAGFEEIVSRLGEPATEVRIPDPGPPPDFAKMAGLLAEHGVEILGPPVDVDPQRVLTV